MFLEELLLEQMKEEKEEIERQVYLTQSVFKVVLQMSIPAQIRQLILCYYSLYRIS